MKVLRAAVTANRYRPVHHNRLPEKTGRLFPRTVSFKVGNAFKPEHLWYLCVGMLSGEFIPLLNQWIQYQLMRELMRQLQVPLVSCDRCHVGECLIQSAMFTAKHILYLILCQVGYKPDSPVAHFYKHLFGLCHAGSDPGILQPGVGLVNVVKRHPFIIEAEAAGIDLSRCNLLPHGFSTRNTSDVSVAVGILTSFQLADHISESASDLLITGGGIHQ